MRNRRVLVTGGAGFIGSHVCEAIAARGDLPVVLDNLSSGLAENLRGIEHELIVGDVRDFKVVSEALEGTEAVVHLAAEPSVPRSLAAPVETHEINYVATMTLLEAMKTSPRRLVYASSAAIYPQTLNDVAREDGLAEPATPYGLDKFAGEHLIRIYRKQFGIQGTALRFFNVYGERQNPKSPYSGVISIFLDCLLARKTCLIFGDGKQVRDFVYVKDVANLIYRMLGDEGDVHLANVGTGKSTSLLDLVRTLENVYGIKADIEHRDARPGDIRFSCADISRVSAYGGWEPRELLAGLREMAANLSPAS